MRIVQLEFLADPWRIAALIGIAFVLAWIVSRASKRLAESLVGRYEKKHVDPEGASTGVIIGLKRRETLVALVQTSVRYVAYVLATLFAVAQLAGVHGSSAIAGASLLVLLLGFALQRFLIDILSGAGSPTTGSSTACAGSGSSTNGSSGTSSSTASPRR